MDELIVLTPYLVPRPIDETTPPIRNFTPRDTLLTLFSGADSQYQDTGTIRQYLDNLQNNIPKMINLSPEKLDPGPKPNLHDGCLGIWLAYLVDTKYHLFSLSPHPPFDELELPQLLEICFDSCMPHNNAIWAIQLFVLDKDIPPEVLFNSLVSNPKYWHKDPIYFSKLGKCLYDRNLLPHSKFIEWMIKELKPEDLTIFKKELIKTHSFLYFAFKSNKAKDYISYFGNDLRLNKSQLIQFSILSQIQDNSYETFSEGDDNCSYEKYIEPLLDNTMKVRAKKIYDLISSYVAFSSAIRNLLFLYFPFFDTETFATEIRKLVHFSSEKELESNLLCICRSVLWFTRCIPAISCNIAYLIKFLLSGSKSAKFPIEEFIKILYEKVDSISKFSILFAELQEYGLINYFDFLKRISKHGFFILRKEETAKIIANLPCILIEDKSLLQIKRILDRIFPNNKFQEMIVTIFKDIKANVDLILDLPFVLQYYFCMFLVSHTDGDDFVEICKTLSKLNVPNLIVPLFQRIFEKDPLKIKWTLEIVPIIEDIISAFSAKNSLEALVSSICGNLQKPGNVELAIFIFEHYKQHKAINNPQYKSTLNELAKRKVITVCREQIIDIFQKYSYMCSLQVFDAFFSVKTVGDFHTIFPVFLKDFFEFDLLTTDDLYDLFLDFSESSCISRSADFFVRNVIIVFCQSNEFCEQERIILMLKSFFSRVLLKRVFGIQSYFETIFGLCPKIRGKTKLTQPPPKSVSILINIILEIIDHNKESFPTESILTENVVKGFNQSFPAENSPFIDLLNLLRSFPPPIINEEIFKIIKSENQQGLTYLAALFSLLPSPLRSPNFIDVFDYFKENVTRYTSTFWALWLKLKYRFNSEFPIGLTQPDKATIDAYRKNLISSFYSLLFHSTQGDEKTLIYLNCWVLLCEDEEISQMVVDSLIKNLQSSLMLMFYQPSLILIDNKTFDVLCDWICKYTYDDMQFEQFVEFASSVFAIYASRFPSSPIIITIADKVLEWIPATYKSHSKCLEYLIDVFNFILCMSNDQSPIKNQFELESFQEDLHFKIKENLEKIPETISKFIVLNVPPQVFVKPKKPLYYDFKLPEVKPLQTIQPNLQFTDDHGFNSPYNGSFNNVYNNNTYGNANSNNYNSGVDQGFSNNFDLPFEDEDNFHDWFN